MVLGPKRADMSKLRWEDTFMLLSHDGELSRMHEPGHRLSLYLQKNTRYVSYILNH